MLEKYFTEEELEELKNNENLLFKALELVTRLFNNKTDKGGFPYSVHLLKVYSGVTDYNEKIIALLHDTIEDTEITDKDLLILFPKEIVNSVKVLTKKKGSDYQKYIDSIINSNDVHAMNVKLSDLTHNMDLNRIKNPSVNDYERVNKRYAPAYERIQNKLKEMEK